MFVLRSSSTSYPPATIWHGHSCGIQTIPPCMHLQFLIAIGTGQLYHPTRELQRGESSGKLPGHQFSPTKTTRMRTLGTIVQDTTANETGQRRRTIRRTFLVICSMRETTDCVRSNRVICSACSHFLLPVKYSFKEDANPHILPIYGRKGVSRSSRDVFDDLW